MSETKKEEEKPINYITRPEAQYLYTCIYKYAKHVLDVVEDDQSYIKFPQLFFSSTESIKSCYRHFSTGYDKQFIKMAKSLNNLFGSDAEIKHLRYIASYVSEQFQEFDDKNMQNLTGVKPKQVKNEDVKCITQQLVDKLLNEFNYEISHVEKILE